MTEQSGRGHRLDRAHVVAWNDAWSSRDRTMVAAAVENIPDPVCIVPLTGICDECG